MGRKKREERAETNKGKWSLRVSLRPLMGPQPTVLALTLPGSCWLLVHPLSVQPLGCGVGLPPTGLSGWEWSLARAPHLDTIWRISLLNYYDLGYF